MNVEQFENYAANGYNRIPVYRPVNLDVPFKDLVSLLTKPKRALLQFRNEKNQIISVLGLSATRIIQYQYRQVTIKEKDKIIKQFDIDTIPPINPIEWFSDYNSFYKSPKLPELPDFYGGMIGYMGASICEFSELRTPKIDSNELPDFAFMLCDDFLVINHETSQVWLITYVDPIERHVYEKAQTKLVKLAENLTAELQNVTQQKATSPQLIQQIDTNALTKLAEQHDFDFLTLYAAQISAEDGFLVFEKMFNTADFPAYFLHFDDFYMFGFGRNSLKKFGQMLELHYQPTIYPDIKVTEARYEHNKIVCQSSLSSLCFEHTMGTTPNIICAELPPTYSAIDAIKATLPHPLQVGEKTTHAFLFAEKNPQNSLTQQRGLVGMLNWHDDFIGQFQFHSWLSYQGKLHYSQPFMLGKKDTIST